MARLYRYANSSDSHGYFLLGHSGEGNTTIQVSQLAKVLLDELGYQPGVLPDDQGPRLPSSLQWALFEADLIGTGGSDVVGDAEDFSEEIDPSTLSEEDIKTIKEFIEEADSHRDELSTLAETLDIEASTSSISPVWELDEQELRMFGIIAYSNAISALNKSEGPDVECETEEEVSDKRARISFGIRPVDTEDSDNEFTHTVLFYEDDDGEENVSCLTDTPERFSPESRIEAERQRGLLMSELLDVLLDQGHWPTRPDFPIDYRVHDDIRFFNPVW